MIDTTPKNKFREVVEFTWEILKIVIISLAIIIPIRYFLIQPFFVNGASMEPNFQDGDYLIVDEISYRFDAPERGDVVIFRYPLDPSQFFIKRVIGLPGESIKVEDGKIFINGKALDESEYLEDIDTVGSVEIKLAEDEYFVLGDNRQASSDSRKWGEVDKKFIIGRAWLRAWPFSRAGILNN
ncbi:signal peptidase I [Patescibacteria group bacterium]|nr:signal peptidase I [Patescibacteria group bacterium]MBU4458611.1 signal peptidase I [Patescibacteria group bacterium]MCG2696252.1 signal peptidase I [Candidatus Portnoybacteria bacterium]